MPVDDKDSRSSRADEALAALEREFVELDPDFDVPIILDGVMGWADRKKDRDLQVDLIDHDAQLGEADRAS